MDISDGRYTTKLLQFLDRANSNNFFQIIAHPKRDGGTPITVTRNVPITSVGDPVGKTLLLNKGWHPIPNRLASLNSSSPPKIIIIIIPSHLFIASQNLVNNRLDTNEPSGNGTIDQRCIRSPAEGITMLHLGLHNQTATLLHVLLNTLIGIL